MGTVDLEALESSRGIDIDILMDILNYIKSRVRFYPSDIAFDLDLDYDLVCEILNHLRKLGIVGDVDD